MKGPYILNLDGDYECKMMNKVGEVSKERDKEKIEAIYRQQGLIEDITKAQE